MVARAGQLQMQQVRLNDVRQPDAHRGKKSKHGGSREKPMGLTNRGPPESLSEWPTTIRADADDFCRLITQYGGTGSVTGPASQATQAGKDERKDATDSGGHGWDERAVGAKARVRPVAVGGERSRPRVDLKALGSVAGISSILRYPRCTSRLTTFPWLSFSCTWVKDLALESVLSGSLVS